MSRGHGRLQRVLLDILEGSDDLLDTFSLAALAFDCRPDADGHTLLSEAQVVSARRALARLAREGRILALGRHWQGGRQRWAGQRAGLRYLIRTAQLQPYGKSGAEARRRGEELAALLGRAEELGVEA